MIKRFISVMVAALLAAAISFPAFADEPAYPGATLEGVWVSMSGMKTYDAKAGTCIAKDMEGNVEETKLVVLSDDGETVTYTDDGLSFTATKMADGSLSVVMKGREKFPISMTREK